MIGQQIHALAQRLFPICRSITGEGVRETLGILKEYLPALTLNEVPSGTKVFDWEIPQEWNITDAYVLDPNGEKIIDFKKSNLHVVGYSTPIDVELSLEELQEHLYSLPNQPDAIPYITSYYKQRWGFCITENQRQKLMPGRYRAVIQSELKSGSLTYAELVLLGKSTDEILISTYVCHPSMGNNELSGPTVTTFIAQYLASLSNRKYTYRIVFIPETIGSITYLSQRYLQLKKQVVAGFNVTCIGDNRCYSFLPSRHGNTLSDHIAQHVLKWTDPDFKKYTWNDRGSDERQYCAPGIDLPIATIMRSKYGEYPEYHTSLDDLVNVVTPEGLDGGYYALKNAVDILEHHCYPKVSVLCEPQLGKRGLYPTLSTKEPQQQVRMMMNFITYADGHLSLLEIAEKSQVAVWDLYPLLEKLMSKGLIQMHEKSDHSILMPVAEYA